MWRGKVDTAQVDAQVTAQVNIESLKEWAYLNPRTFVPKVEVLERYSMPANAAASKVASLQNQKMMPFEEWIGALPTDPAECAEKQRELREHIDGEFIDINAYMLELIEGKQKHKKQIKKHQKTAKKV